MKDVDQETKNKIEQLQFLEQNINTLLAQKQQFQSQLLEVESALNELETTTEAYKIVGNIMVLSKKPDLKKDLDSKKEILNLRIKNIEKQETKIREKATNIQQEVMAKLKK
ncbi:prefoldin subunit beta [Candidatus Woesearchaeota archaeon]|nr:prefoldin subunit beta [Candidatus Woesearchaeota archaeon]